MRAHQPTRFLLRAANSGMRKTAIILVLILITLVSKSQDIVAWRKQLEDRVIRQSKRENLFKATDRADIIAVPIYFYACPGTEIVENKKGCVPTIDSFAAYAVIMNKSEMKGIAQNTGKRRFGFYTITELQRLKRKEYEDSTYRMIRLARSLSSNYFFLYFLPAERNRYEIIAVIQKGKTKYIDRNLKVYQGLRELVTDRYETTQKFVKRMDDQHIKRILQKNMTFDEARKITQEDYIQYTERHPQDTTGIMQRFLIEFITQAQVPVSRKAELENTILAGLWQAPLFRDKRFSIRIPFFDRNIYPWICSFVTPEQLKKYQEYRSVRTWLIGKAYEKLSMENNWQ
jgi:hypothetical protein